MSRSAFTALAAAGASIAAIGFLAPAAHAEAPACTAYAAPSGNDSAAGTIAAPKRTAQALADSLNPGDTGCLRAGSYSPGVVFRKGGTASARLTLRSAPGEKATVNGEVRVTRTAPNVTISGLYINGASLNRTNPTINAPDVEFTNNDVTNEHTEICFMLGHHDYGRADRALIANNRIHDCGLMPSRNQDHGIYVGAATGARIQNNWIYDNADRGIQLYPDAQQTTITGNVIDNNGEGIIFSGEGLVVNDTRVEHNVISNSNIRGNIESWWAEGTAPGVRNTVGENCLHATNPNAWYRRNGGVNTDGGGFTADSTNVQADPGFANAAARDLRLTTNSPCRRVLGAAADSVPGPGDDAGEPALPPVPAGPVNQPASPLPGESGGDAPQGIPATPAPDVPASAPAGPAAPVKTKRPAARRGVITLRLAGLRTRSARASASARSRTIALAGTVAAGRTSVVTIQALVRGRWVAVARATVRRGGFSATVAPTKLGGTGRVQLRAAAANLGVSAPIAIGRR